VRSLGASSILVRGKDDPLQSSERFDVIFDTAVAYSYGKMKHLLNPGGTYLTTLPGPGIFLSMPVARLQGKHAGFAGVLAKRADFELLAKWVSEGMQIPIDSTYPVRDVGKAIGRMTQGGMKGRIVVTVEGGF
jgi:D-arabinose 1-dehydrogenase-like Zn-dependent alcohol dehydrogenase